MNNKSKFIYSEKATQFENNLPRSKSKWETFFSNFVASLKNFNFMNSPLSMKHPTPAHTAAIQSVRGVDRFLNPGGLTVV